VSFIDALAPVGGPRVLRGPRPSVAEGGHLIRLAVRKLGLGTLDMGLGAQHSRVSRISGPWFAAISTCYKTQIGLMGGMEIWPCRRRASIDCREFFKWKDAGHGD